MQLDEHADRPEEKVMRWITHAVRRRIVLHSEGMCFHCKKRAARAALDRKGLPGLYDEKGRKFHIDHLVPSCIGGNDKEENLVMSCPECNMKKKRQTLRYKEEVDRFIEMVNAKKAKP